MKRRKPKPDPVPANFKQTARRIDNDLARRRAWLSRDGRWRVVESKPKYGQAKTPVYYAEAYEVTAWGSDQWVRLTPHRHRTRRAAFRTVEKAARALTATH